MVINNVTFTLGGHVLILLVSFYWFPQWWTQERWWPAPSTWVLSTASASLFVSMLVFYTLCAAARKNFAVVLNIVLRGIIGHVIGTVVTHTFLILFGAPVIELASRTLALSTLYSSVVFIPFFSMEETYMNFNEWVRIVLRFQHKSSMEVWLAVNTISSALGIYFGAIPIPLDWDREWQQWPMTCVCGLIIGQVFAVVFTIVYYYFVKLSSFKGGKYN